ncbi:ATP-binding cassette domain-containing protein [Shigella sonnei]|nr:ATP-binding cassette domain-containing protein [Shigella sonnei]ELO6230007.1 ATP-binding cassette domain-containing protein [Escherichia coli]EFP7823715.1 ATP-binding cassette domain-containing protein [Shigella sonnei]EFP8105230.1 ATP-binding cassette domain-containing protein [Shigella sonnei]EFP8829464.1 ATP-binding cassette domain-containing protein [Shigella sonnei]
MQQSTPYLSFRGIGKTFPGVKALTDISFDCYAGQVHALMGENGAGKSTLLKILSGNYAPTTGSVVINGQEMSFSDTTAALNAGVAIIYQELHLVPEMTVAENIYLGQLPHKGGIVNRSLLNYEAGLQLKHLGMDIDPDTPLKYLSIGQWQMVEIAKALARNAKIIAFDEPTSSLSAREIDNHRKAEGIIPVHSVRDNINISARRKHVLGGCVINNGWEENNADQHIRSLNIKTPGAEQLIMNLSGGNQQKAILGRWLSEEMKVILLDEPTRSIDVGAKHEIYNVIYALAAQGVAVLFASSDLPEVLGVADRIVVMREGEIAGELLHEQADERQALSLAMPKVSQAVA